MKWSHVAKHWHAFVPNILTQWPDLDSDEVEATEGELGPFLDHLCEVSGMSREDARDEVSEWLEGTDPADAVGAAANVVSNAIAVAYIEIRGKAWLAGHMRT